MKDLEAIKDIAQDGGATVARRPPSSLGLSPASLQRWLPIPIADRYLLSSVMESTLRGLSMFVMLLLFFAVITATRKLLDNSLSMAGALELVIYQLPRIVLFTLPMSVLFGTLNTFAEFSARGELTALWAGGMSLPRMLRPMLGWALVLAICAFWMQETIVPIAETRKNDVLAHQITHSTTIQRDIRFRDELPNGGSRELAAEEFNPKAKTLKQPRVRTFNKKDEFESEISAQRAEWNIKSGKWKFFNAHVKQWDEASRAQGAQQIGGTFGTMEFDAPPPRQLGKKALSRRENLEKANYEMVSINELQLWRDGLQSHKIRVAASERRKMIDSATFGIHDKIATPLITLALVLVAAPLGIRPQRSSGGVSIGLSLVVLLLYYVLWTWTSALGKGAVVNPYLAAYVPLIGTLIIGIFLVWKKSR